MHLVKPIKYKTNEYVCMACKIDQHTSLKLNKHIIECKEYKSFIKTYIPPKGINCPKCNKTFVDEKYLKNHHCF